MFCIYILAVGHIIRKYGFSFHIYADDTQIYVTFDVKCYASAAEKLHDLECCIQEIRSWMTDKKLKLNDDKTEFLIITTPHYQNAMKKLTLKMGDINVACVSSARNLGVFFDNIFGMKPHISAICKASYYQLRNIGSIRKYLTADASAQLVHAFITSRLDYCNSLLYGLPDSYLHKLQRVQNTAARIISLTKKYDHITPVLKSLHWLPVRLRVRFKVSVLTFKVLNDLAPSYLKALISVKKTSIITRSEGSLYEPRSRLVSYGDRAFSIAGPRLWNDLPKDVKESSSITIFKARLKTLLFKEF